MSKNVATVKTHAVLLTQNGFYSRVSDDFQQWTSSISEKCENQA